MTKKFISKKNAALLLQSMQEAVDFDNGVADISGYRVHVPEAVDIKNIRGKLSMTQAKFGETFGFSKRAIEDWEQSRRQPQKSARILLRLIEKSPEFVLENLSTR